MGKNNPTRKIKAQKVKLQRVVSDCKARIKTELSRYKSALTNLRRATKQYESAYTKYIKKPNERNNEAVETSLEQVREYNDIREATSSRIDALIAVATDSVKEHVELLGGDTTKEGAKLALSFEGYKDALTKHIDKLESGVIDAIPESIDVASDFAAGHDDEYDCAGVDADTDDLPDFDYSGGVEEGRKNGTPTSSPVSTSTPAPAKTHQTPSASSGVTSVNISPINLDVTPMVERAIASTMQHLTEELDSRIRDYISGITFPTVPATPVPTPYADTAPTAPARHSGAMTDLEEHVLGEEQHIYEKLRDMCESLSTLVDGIAEVSGTYMTLTAKLKEVAELQKKVNDLQRQTMRDQQGIQVSQRLVNDEQLELTTAQRLIAEKQTEVASTASGLAEAQSAILDNERALVESQREIEGAMRAFMDAERDILAAQQAFIQSGIKTQESQRALNERQEEVVVKQKETMTAQRQVQKEQRTVSERQSAISQATPKATKRRAIPKEEMIEEYEVAEGVIVPKPIPDPEPPDLGELSAHEEFSV